MACHSSRDSNSYHLVPVTSLGGTSCCMTPLCKVCSFAVVSSPSVRNEECMSQKYCCPPVWIWKRDYGVVMNSPVTVRIYQFLEERSIYGQTEE